ncbi:MAG: hypothetical protein KBD50_03855 [Candidatus Pacebacteria bacterium]|nr:hypothetical protein [Candidatus Paceibacterota bacterium]
MVKLALWFAGLVAVVGIGAWLWFGGMLDPLLSDFGLAQNEEPATTNEQPQIESELSTGSDTSDQALEQDLSTLDTQLGAYNESSAEVDGSLQDQAVVQEY